MRPTFEGLPNPLKLAILFMVSGALMYASGQLVDRYAGKTRSKKGWI